MIDAVREVLRSWYFAEKEAPDEVRALLEQGRLIERRAALAPR